MNGGTTTVAVRPKLVQFCNLRPEHFGEHPVWVQCHTVDYERPWYDDTDEETFRPWDGALPADASELMLLIPAQFKLNDGTELEGFLTPAVERKTLYPADILGSIQPHIWLPSGRSARFWDGTLRRSADEASAVYAELGRGPSQIFPITYSGLPGLATGVISGQIHGFCSQAGTFDPVRIDV